MNMIRAVSSQLPIPYVPTTDLLATKESSKNLKNKPPNGTIFTLTILSQENNEEYLAHIIAVLCLISNQKGLNVLCRKVVKMLEKQAMTLGELEKSIGPKGLSSKEDQEARRVELKQIQEMLEAAKKEHNEAAAKTYELLRNLLSGNPQTQQNWI